MTEDDIEARVLDLENNRAEQAARERHIATNLTTQTAVDKEDLIRLEGKIDTLIVVVTGNGAPERGVIVRLDRVEQWRAELDRRIDSLSARIGQVLIAIVLMALVFIGSVLTHAITIEFPR